MTKKIELTQGYYALVDDEDYEELSQYGWSIHFSYNKPYAQRGDRRNGKRRGYLMHRQIFEMHGIDLGQLEVDHINGDGLDNRKINLRPATRAQNSRNRLIDKRNTSGFLGVSYDRPKRKWRAQIRHNGKTKFLGRFNTPQEAARVYDEAAKRYHGDFASLNFEK